MASPRQWYDGVHMYLGELGARVVARSGRPADRHHLGKLILQSFLDAPDHVLQIDGATGESETFGSMLERSVRCAGCFAQRGVGYGDVIAIMAPNHLDIGVPFYAALYLGVIIAAVDRTLGVLELQGSFSVSRPKLIFCQSEKAPDVQLALNEAEVDAQIVTFDGGDYLCSFQQFMEAGVDVAVEEFEAADFDPAEATAFLIATSGTTGLPKAAEATHKNFATSSPYLWIRHDTFPTPTRMALIGSPLQWLTALMNFVMTPIFRYTRLQTSLPLTREHCYHLLNTYKPTWTVFSPTFMAAVIKAADRDQCDFSCLETMLLGGSAAPADLIAEIKLVTPTTEVFNAFGMSEITGVGFCNDDTARPWICGRPLGCLKYRIIDPGTGLDVTEPNVPGELWLKGPGIVKGYYNNPEATAETFSEDGWFKTGDMFYRDEHHYYVYVERIKLLLKYMSYQISPIEIESVIRTHPAVLDVAVTGLPDEACGELPVACVVRRDGCDVSAEEIKDLVKDSLSDAKQLRGGVIFLDQIPMTASTKVHRRQVKEIALTHPRE
ncbi:luciferin 4-monooxygenase [Plutella xylostella]|uniref:luciferin 4-monooxygenase n=1 Tax=Plutella xylostella TaxID=51655 RepID=UPI0020328E9B|nr:luciferin 4-monooxygenase [Plutella xylostella]